MQDRFQVLWLNASPSLKHFDMPLLRYLSQHIPVFCWEYSQTQDEACSLDQAVVLLHDYLKFRNAPVHLAGHGMGGVVGLMYARRYPRRVCSLTLLAVAAQPATTWHTHYYVQRQLLPCSRQQVLAQMVRSLFGSQFSYPVRDLVAALSRDLEETPALHSLFKLVSLTKGGVSAPLMICGSESDPVVSPLGLYEWHQWLKPGDRLIEFADGHHFFHTFYPEQVGAELLEFWQATDVQQKSDETAQTVPHQSLKAVRDKG